MKIHRVYWLLVLVTAVLTALVIAASIGANRIEVVRYDLRATTDF